MYAKAGKVASAEVVDKPCVDALRAAGPREGQTNFPDETLYEYFALFMPDPAKCCSITNALFWTWPILTC